MQLLIKLVHHVLGGSILVLHFYVSLVVSLDRDNTPVREYTLRQVRLPNKLQVLSIDGLSGGLAIRAKLGVMKVGWSASFVTGHNLAQTSSTFLVNGLYHHALHELN